jgi:hypothetical protein
MQAQNIVLILLVLGVWVFVAIKQFLSARKQTGWNRWLGLIAPILLVIGGFGFFGSALSSEGGLNWLPETFEWPVGFATGVVATPDHFFVVPDSPSGRIQVYDSTWKFVRGWHVNAGGGMFRLYLSPDYQKNVVTARGKWHYIYSLQGHLLSKEEYGPAAYDSFPKEGRSYVVLTAPWLWVFTSPVYSWIAAMVGMVLLLVKDRIPRKTKIDQAPA